MSAPGDTNLEVALYIVPGGRLVIVYLHAAEFVFSRGRGFCGLRHIPGVYTSSPALEDRKQNSDGSL